MHKQNVKPIPDGMPTITPHLVCNSAAAAIEFYQQAFGAVELTRLPGEGGKLMHACIRINGASVMLADEYPEMGSYSPTALQGTPVTIHLIVDDVDRVAEQAISAGAKVVMPVADMFWGDRYGVLEDPFGHHWSIATPKHPMTEDELREAARAALANDPAPTGASS